MQVTAGSLTGRFGPGARYYAERMLDEGIVHILATDSHGVKHRPPALAEGRLEAARWVGEEEAARLVLERPRAILDNAEPSKVAHPPGLNQTDRREQAQPSLWRRLFRGRGRDG
jgi:protein-tyrosine phosphatase